MSEWWDTRTVTAPLSWVLWVKITICLFSSTQPTSSSRSSHLTFPSRNVWAQSVSTVFLSICGVVWSVRQSFITVVKFWSVYYHNSFSIYLLASLMPLKLYKHQTVTWRYNKHIDKSIGMMLESLLQSLCIASSTVATHRFRKQIKNKKQTFHAHWAEIERYWLTPCMIVVRGFALLQWPSTSEVPLSIQWSSVTIPSIVYNRALTTNLCRDCPHPVPIETIWLSDEIQETDEGNAYTLQGERLERWRWGWGVGSEQQWSKIPR